MRKIIILFMILLIISGCKDNYEAEKTRNSNNYYKYETYPEYKKEKVEDLLNHNEKFVMDYWKKVDKNTTYEYYIPNTSDIESLKKAIDMLPEANKWVIKNRIFRIYYISNLMAGGITDRVFDKDGNEYYILIINPILLKMNLNEWLTMKENTMFKNNNAKRIKVEISEQYSSLFGILLHETGHMVDNECKVTPYVFENKGDELKTTRFTEGVWKLRNEPIVEFNNRKKITAYGLLNGPVIDIKEADKVYKSLSKTPFISLYGSQDWAEDYAEYTLFRYFFEKGFDYKIYLDDKIVREPFKSDIVARRIINLKLYEEIDCKKLKQK